MQAMRERGSSGIISRKRPIGTLLILPPSFFCLLHPRVGRRRGIIQLPSLSLADSPAREISFWCGIRRSNKTYNRSLLMLSRANVRMVQDFANFCHCGIPPLALSLFSIHLPPLCIPHSFLLSPNFRFRCAPLSPSSAFIPSLLHSVPFSLPRFFFVRNCHMPKKSMRRRDMGERGLCYTWGPLYSRASMATPLPSSALVLLTRSLSPVKHTV